MRIVVLAIGKHQSFGDILNKLKGAACEFRLVWARIDAYSAGVADLPETINHTYIDQSSYWLTYFPCVRYSTRASPAHTDLNVNVALGSVDSWSSLTSLNF